MIDNNPVLVNIFRGEIVESFHRGVVCVVDADNRILLSHGDVKQVCYPRSALKYFQHLPLFSSQAIQEFGFTKEELALMCGSHNGEKKHIQGVESILSKIGLSEDELQCGPQMPTLREDQMELIKEGKHARKIHNNCSGKHAGFLAYCVYKGYPIHDYISPFHPHQIEIRQLASDFHEYPLNQIETGIDGCSAPIFSFPVFNQAVAYKNLIAPAQFDAGIQKACQLVVEVVSAYPFMVAGSHRYCTDLLREGNGKVIGKTGADGIYSIGLPEEKIGICIKIDDGKMGPQYNVAQQLLSSMKILSDKQQKTLDKYICEDNFNYAKVRTGYTDVNHKISWVPDSNS